MKPTGRVQHALDSTGEAGRGSLDLEFEAIVGDECDIVRCRCHNCGMPVVYGKKRCRVCENCFAELDRRRGAQVTGVV